jgi:uncharacterized protein (UPF0218 family)
MYVLPESLRSELKEPFGPVASGSFADELGDGPITTVGDVVTHQALDDGVNPNTMIVDGITKRDEDADPIEPGDDTERITVENPAAKITSELWQAVASAYANDHPTLIEVDGEEDLATLPAIVHAPKDANVVYGQPDEGAVIVTVDQITRERALDVLARMEVV